MGNKTLVYRQKVKDNLKESLKHLCRIEDAFSILEKKYLFPIDKEVHKKVLSCMQDIAFCDQVIYRFSKLQDCMGAKLFKSVLLYQGENINKPFLDILNQLEAMDIINVDKWFELRDLRNEIAHDYEDSDEICINILNSIYKLKKDLKVVLNSVKNLVQKEQK